MPGGRPPARCGRGGDARCGHGGWVVAAGGRGGRSWLTAAVSQPLPSLRRPPIGFAHRGGMAHAPENTLEAFRLALRLGASGLESDAWLTADGVVVLHHDRSIGTFR